MLIPVSEELLDVVNENNVIVDIKTRREIHASSLMHRSVHILVFNKKHDLFIQRRSLSKDNHPGLWAR
jgi:isopentenyldiphosphate isomerase